MQVVIRIFLDTRLTRHHLLVVRHGAESFVLLWHVVDVSAEGLRCRETTCGSPARRSGRRSPAADWQRGVAPADVVSWVYVATGVGAVRVNWPVAAAAAAAAAAGGVVRRGRGRGATGAEQVRESGAELGAERAVQDEVCGTVDHHQQVEHVTGDQRHLCPNTQRQYRRVLYLFIILHKKIHQRL